VEKRQWDSSATLFASEARERAEIPPTVSVPMHFSDSHLHLADYPDPDAVAGQSSKGGIDIVAVSVDRKSSFRSLDIARRHPASVRAFVGQHPSEAEKGDDLEWFESALEGAAGCGEVGLDPSYLKTSDKSRQYRVFSTLLGMTEKAGKPVQVHSRGAENECLQELTGFRLTTVLLHWFQGEALVSQVIDRGYYVSFGPALLYGKRLQRMASSLDPSRVLTESDGPVPFKALGGVQGPFMVPSVIYKLAGIWGIDFEEARETVETNSRRYLGIGEKG
jgi:TatD DNase family protein